MFGENSLLNTRGFSVNWRIVIIGSVSLFFAISVLYLFLGQPNADEGWYLYASKLVYEGKIPYRDFAYTQTPFLPYVYGLPQVIFQPGMYLGRATSIGLSIVNLVLSISIARRYAGKAGAGLTALLLSTFTYGIYFGTIVKTYALLSVLFTLTFYVLASKLPAVWKYPIAVTLSYLAAMTRLSALIFFVCVLAYALASASRLKNKRTLILIAGTLLTIAAGTAFFIGPAVEAAKWNLLTHHVAQWEESSAAFKALRILIRRVPDFIGFYDYYVFALFPFLFLVLRDRDLRIRGKDYLLRNLPLLIIGVGLTLFAASHFVTGSWHREYFVPAVTSFIPIIAITVTKILNLSEISSCKGLLHTVLFIASLMAPMRHNIQYLDISGNELPLEEIIEVSETISQHSDAADRIFALEALGTVVESNRSVLPGMTMAQFSYQDIDKDEAQRLRLVNTEMILEYIASCSAKMIVLTDLDWQMFEEMGDDRRIRQQLSRKYRLFLEKEAFGQYAENVYLYLCEEQ